MMIDLSVDLNEKTPVYPGDPETKISPAGVLETSGYTDYYVCVGTHVGTHMDAPSHMVAGGKNLDAFPIEKFSGRGVYVRVEGEVNLAGLQKIDIQEGDIVLFHTGMSDKYHDASCALAKIRLESILQRRTPVGSPVIKTVDIQYPDNLFPVTGNRHVP